MSRRPSRLWLFFYGRRRRGFPGLLVTVLAVALLAGLTFASRMGASVSYWIGLAFAGGFAVLILVALAAALLGVLRPPGRR